MPQASGQGSGVSTRAARSAASACASKRQPGVAVAPETYRSDVVWVQQFSGRRRLWPFGTLPVVSTPRHCSSTKGYSWSLPALLLTFVTSARVGTAPSQLTSKLLPSTQTGGL
ncbi:hypothetical protein [Aeromicrobium sp. UC242_57]|uniref:hypothetical protein n=1 Tax=Aeromicrobium sp. UC242_57 TaxID=3374624 RepID=UPI0037B39A05